MDRFTGSQLGPMLSMYPRWQACTLLCKPGKESWPQDTHVLVQQVTFVAWLCQSCGKGCTFFVHGFPVGLGSCSSTFEKRGASMDRFTGSQLGDKLVGLSPQQLRQSKSKPRQSSSSSSSSEVSLLQARTLSRGCSSYQTSSFAIRRSSSATVVSAAQAGLWLAFLKKTLRPCSCTGLAAVHRVRALARLP